MDTIENYKMVNGQMSKTIAALKGEVTKLKNENNKLTADSLQLIRLKKQIADSQRIQFDHVNALTVELQSFVGKINEIALSNVRNQIGEKSLSNLSVNNSEVSQRMSQSYESRSPVEQRRSTSRNDQEEIGLHTIAEEIEEGDETDTTRNTTQSTITSQCQSTIANLNSIKNSLLDPSPSTSIESDTISVTNNQSIASNSMDSSKENQSSHKKQDMINDSNEDEAKSGVVSNTEQSILTILSESDVYETETEATYASNTRSKRDRNTKRSFSTLTNDSTTIGTSTMEGEILQPDAISITNSHSIASNAIDSNKENQSSKGHLEYFGALSPLNNVDFVTNRRKKQDVINHSNEDGGISGPVASTPLRFVSETNTEQSILTLLSESDVCETETEATNVPNTRSKRVRNTTKSFSTLTNNSATIGANTKEVENVPLKRTKNTGKIFSDLSNSATATATIPIELSNPRPKRKASQAATFVEPKLNTKLRRPLSMKPKVSAKPKRTRT